MYEEKSRYVINALYSAVFTVYRKIFVFIIYKNVDL